MNDYLLVRDLSVTYSAGSGDVPAVRGVSFGVEPGSKLGVAGESGCGKSTVALALLRLLPRSARISGQVLLDGEDALAMRWGRLRAVRWAQASVIFQGSMNALNPVQKISDQICEPILLHDKVTPRAARRRAAELLDSVGVPSRRMHAYPHELSGGQRQRVMIAMALACRPNLIIADEPTTALDVMVQAQILQLLSELVTESRIGVIMISHDLSVLAGMCDRLAIMYAGTLVETGPAQALFDDPRHPYLQALAGAFPRIGDPGSRLNPTGIPGDPPVPGTIAEGCPFAPRCSQVMPECHTATIGLWPSGPDRAAACLRVLPEHAGAASEASAEDGSTSAAIGERGRP